MNSLGLLICLLGQLSAVGLRLGFPDEALEYNERTMQCLAVKPGITGYKNDLWLITKTLKVVISGNGSVLILQKTGL